MSNTPNIRFKGFIDDWEQRKLGDLCERITRKNKNAESDLPLTIASHYGLIDQRDFFNKVVAAKDMSNYYLLKKGEFAYNKSYSNGYDYGSIKRLNAYEKGCLSTLYICFGITSDDIESDYLECFFDTLKWYSDITMICAEGARNHGLLNVDTKAFFDEVTIEMPSSKDEQKKISAYLNNLDNLITLHQRKCNETKKLKKYMLQKMFPKKGEKNPEIRFEGFTDDWEQRKYSDIASTRRGLTYKPTDVSDKGKRVLRSSNINEDTFELHEDDVFVDEGAVNIPYVKNGDILITSANGSSRLIGKHAIICNIPDDSVVHGGFMLLASSEEPEFVNALMSSQWYTKFINVYVAGGNGAIGNLNKNDLDEQFVMVPSKPEREKLGALFSSIDNLITLHQRKCDELKEIKKYMLQNMFPKKGD